MSVRAKSPPEAGVSRLAEVRVRAGMIVILKAQVNCAWRSSMEIGVRVEAEEPTTGLREHCCSAYLTFVAVDERGSPRAVAPLTLETDEEIETFAAEMIDRFGPMPPEVQQLMKLVSIKALCRHAHVEKVDAGPKGVIIAFRDNSFANPQGLVRYIASEGPDAKVRPDMKIVFVRDFESVNDRLEGVRAFGEKRKARFNGR